MTAIVPKYPVTITTPRLVIRSAIPSDAKPLYLFFSKPENMAPGDNPDPNISTEVFTTRIDKWKTMAQDHKTSWLVICLKETSELIGYGGYNTFEAPKGPEFTEAEDLDPEIGALEKEKWLTDIGVMIDHAHQRKGYALEAVVGQIQYAFNELELGVIRIETGTENSQFRLFMNEGVGLKMCERHAKVSWPPEQDKGWVWKFGEDAWFECRKKLKDGGRWPLDS